MSGCKRLRMVMELWWKGSDFGYNWQYEGSLRMGIFCLARETYKSE